MVKVFRSFLSPLYLSSCFRSQFIPHWKTVCATTNCPGETRRKHAGFFFNITLSSVMGEGSTSVSLSITAFAYWYIQIYFLQHNFILPFHFIAHMHLVLSLFYICTKLEVTFQGFFISCNNEDNVTENWTFQDHIWYEAIYRTFTSSWYWGGAHHLLQITTLSTTWSLINAIQGNIEQLMQCM